MVQKVFSKGKRKKFFVSAATKNSSNPSRRLFIFDPLTKLEFLIDTGSEATGIPPNGQPPLPRSSLCAANGSIINEYGEKEMKISLGLKREFIFKFTIAEIKHPIIGADFLHQHNLLVDIRKGELIDGQTGQRVKGSVRHVPPAISSVTKSPEFLKLLEEFPELTQPTARHKGKFPHGVTHAIETTGPPIHFKARRLPPEKLEVARQTYNEYLENGDAIPSKSPWASPLHMAPYKGDKPWRACGDYRALNARTKPDKYPVPNILDFNAELRGAKIFTVLDIKKAYNNIPIRKEDIEKTAVITPFGLFNHVNMPFGLKNAGATWQRFIDSVFRNWKNVYAYIDDILIASKQENSHVEDVRKVLRRLNDAGLRINPDKCQFWQKKVLFLGHEVTEKGIQPDHSKVESIIKFEKPKLVKDLRRFLGMVNFYRRNIPHAANIQRRLQCLITTNKKNDKTVLKWTADAEQAFTDFKKALARAAILAHPHPNAEIILSTDASDTAIGATLQQKVHDRKQPLAFFSRKLSDTERKYATYDRELLAIFAAIKHFYHQLEGRIFAIETDHRPLQFAFTSANEKASPRVKRQLNFISEFTTDIRYIKGKSNIPADVLSRIEEISKTTELDYDQLAIEQTRDDELQELLRSNDTNLRLRKRKYKNQTLIGDTSTGEFRPYITPSLREAAFQAIHGFSHPGPKATAEQVAKSFVWPHMKRNCQRWAKCCKSCQRSKVTRHIRSPLETFKKAGRFEHLHIDIVGKLPSCSGKEYVVTMIDRTTNWVEAETTQSITAETIANILFKTWISRYGVPARLTSDQGKQFDNELIRKLADKFGFSKIRTTAYYPESNGKIERWHRAMKAALMAYGNTNWVKILPIILLGLRNAINTETGVSSAQLTFGQRLKLPADFFEEDINENLNPRDLVENISTEIQKFIKDSRQHSKTPIFVPPEIRTCTHVFLKEEKSDALRQPYTGPYKVLKRNNKTFTLEGGKIVNINKLKPAFLLDNNNEDCTVHQEKTSPKSVLKKNTSNKIDRPKRTVRFSGIYPR